MSQNDSTLTHEHNETAKYELDFWEGMSVRRKVALITFVAFVLVLILA